MIDSAMTMTEAPPGATETGLDFDSFADGLDEGAALAALRAAAWRRYGELPFPSKKTEEWRYTDLAKVDFEAYAPARPQDDVEESLPEKVRAAVKKYYKGYLILRSQ